MHVVRQTSAEEDTPVQASTFQRPCPLNSLARLGPAPLAPAYSSTAQASSTKPSCKLCHLTDLLTTCYLQGTQDTWQAPPTVARQLGSHRCQVGNLKG